MKTSIDAAKFIIAQLQKEYKRDFNKAAVDKIFPELVKEPHKAMEIAFDHFILNSAYLPSPAQLLTKVQAEGKRIRLDEAREREEKWKKEKGEDEHGRVEGSTFLSKQQRDEYAQRGLMMVKLAITSGQSRELMEGCLVMASTYPQFRNEWMETRRDIIRSSIRKNISRGEPDKILELERQLNQKNDPTEEIDNAA